MLNRLLPFLAVCTAFPFVPAQAQGAFLPAGDIRLREDLTVLADEGVIVLPLSTWPVMRADVTRAVRLANRDAVGTPALQAALARVEAVIDSHPARSEWTLRRASLSLGEPGLLRSFDAPAREAAEVMVSAGAATDRYSLTLAATGALEASEGQALRFDGSEASVRLGNWLFSANQLDRWWGPGYDGSLILSSNARPMAAVSLDRIESLPIDLPVLRWLGPWRFSGFFGLGERHRPDVDLPVFMGMRLTFKPSRLLEFGLSRSAQFCGKGRRCDLATFGRVLIGQDNVYLRGLDDPRDEPGNQMAGFDGRLVSPFPALPVAAYAQFIGEDNSDSRIPVRYLRLGGAEVRWSTGSGATFRAHAEFADTSVSWFKLFRPGVDPDTAYRQNIFSAGYRYRGHNIGHTADADSRVLSAGMSLTTQRGHRWAVLARHGQLDRYGSVDPYNPLTNGPSSYDAIELSWQASIRRNRLRARLGHEHQTPRDAGDARGLYGNLRWLVEW